MMVDINKRKLDKQQEMIREGNMRAIMVWLLKKGFTSAKDAYELAEHAYSHLAGEIEGSYFIKNDNVCRRLCDTNIAKEIEQDLKNLN